MNSLKTITYIMIVVRSVIYGVSVLFTGRLLASTAIFDVLALRFLMSTTLFVLLKYTNVIKIDFKGKNLKLLLLAAVFEPACYFIFETLGIKGTTTMMAGIMLSMTPVLVVIFETIILKEKTTTLQKIFLVVGVVGVIYIVLNSQGNDGKNELAGMLFMFLALLSAGSFIVCSRKSSFGFNAIEITYFMNIVGAVVFNAINVVIHISNGNIMEYFVPLGDMQNLVGLLFLSALSSVVATGMNNFALSKIQASSVSALGSISTITTITVGVVFNKEKFLPYHMIGTILILAGGIGINYLRNKKITIG